MLKATAKSAAPGGGQVLGGSPGARGRAPGQGKTSLHPQAGSVQVAKAEGEVTAQEKEELAQRAMEELKCLLMDVSPGEELKGGVVVPPDWAARFKRALGPYKRFVEQYPTEFSITLVEGTYYITLAPGATPLSEEAIERARAGIAEGSAAQAASSVACSGQSGLPMMEVLPTGAAPASLITISGAKSQAQEAPWAAALKEAFDLYASVRGPHHMSADEFLEPLPPPLGRRGPEDAFVMNQGAQVGAPPQPEYIRVMQSKYGLVMGKVYQVVGQAKRTWKLRGGRTIPLEHEGLGWHRLSAAEAEPLLQEDAEAPAVPTKEEDEGEGAGGPLASVGPPPPPSPPWVVIEHPEHPGTYYYFNEDSGESLWEMPSADGAEQRPQSGGPPKKKKKKHKSQV